LAAALAIGLAAVVLVEMLRSQAVEEARQPAEGKRGTLLLTLAFMESLPYSLVIALGAAVY